MKKVIINTCFGLYRLSSEALARVYALKHPNEKYFLYLEQKEDDVPYIFEKYVLIDDVEKLIGNFEKIIIASENFGDTIILPIFKDEYIQERLKQGNQKKDFFNDFFPYSEEEILKICEEAKTISQKIQFVSSDDFERDDKDLIKVIEEIGEDRASGIFAELKMVEIEDNVEYTIEYYDGQETIEVKNEKM